MDLETAFTDRIYKCVLSNTVSGDAKYRKITLTRLGHPAGGDFPACSGADGNPAANHPHQIAYQAEKLTSTQAFHENLSFSEARALLSREFGANFRQCAMWDGEYEHSFKISGNGKLLKNKRLVKTPPKPAEGCGHDRVKNYILSPGRTGERFAKRPDSPGVVAPLAAAPLVDMGVFTKDGQIVGSAHGKYRQINRFLEIVDDEIAKFTGKSINVVDFGCGKSWLTFVLYHYLTEIRGLCASITGLDLKADVVAKCRAAAEKYGYGGLKFACGDIRDFRPDAPVDMVVCLHACDTATDDALVQALLWNARVILAVPCCQHELMHKIENGDQLPITKHGILRERMASLVTDALRGQLLEACGYTVQIMEFIATEHTPKNILIRAVRKSGFNQQTYDDYKKFAACWHIEPYFESALLRYGLIPKNTPDEA